MLTYTSGCWPVGARIMWVAVGVVAATVAGCVGVGVFVVVGWVVGRVVCAVEFDAA